MEKFLGSKLDRFLFIGALVLAFLTIVGLLVYGQFIKDDPTVDEMTYEDERPKFKAKVSFPVTVHIVGRQSDDRINAVHDAVDGWKNATNGVVQVNIAPNWEPPMPFSIRGYEDYDVNTLWFLDPDDDGVAFLLANSDGPVDGASQGRFIVVIDRPRVHGLLLRAILKHEFGHFFGLIHLTPEWSGIMLKDPSTNGDRIGRYDVIQFCALYPCNG